MKLYEDKKVNSFFHDGQGLFEETDFFQKQSSQIKK